MLEKLPLLFPGISLRPALACEVTSHGVLAARHDPASGLLTQFIPLAPGALQPGLKSPNLSARHSVVEALKQALNSVAERGRPIPGGRGRELRANRALTVIVPDASVRVLLLDFDALPSKRVEALTILRFRLRKLVPFDTESAAITWQTMGSSTEGIRVLVIVIPHDVLLEYESAIREAGFVPGVVLPSTVAAMPLLGTEPALLVNHNATSLTTTIVRGQDLLLHRSLDFSGNEELPPDAPPRLPRSTESREREEEEDIRQGVSVALAYYEDTLSTPAEEIFYIGAGSPRAFQALLGEPVIAVRDLGSRDLEDAPERPSTKVPRSLLAPVLGALLNA